MWGVREKSRCGNDLEREMRLIKHMLRNKCLVGNKII